VRAVRAPDGTDGYDGARSKGGNVARDKRTARAVARRRYREQVRAQEAAAEAEANADPTVTTSEADAPARPKGLTSTFADLLRVPDIRADLRALPGIARGTWAVILPVAAAGAAFVVALDPNVYNLQTAQPGDSLTLTVARGIFQFVLLPPPVTPVFVAGVLAPRASWLTGAIAGLVSTALFVALVAIHEPAKMSAGLAIDLVVLYLPLYVLLGGFAGWYRRWLTGRQQKTRQATEERRRARARDDRRARTATARR
jgi:hypothetical protein